MASESVKDATLRLTIETAGAERAIKNVEKQAENAQKAMDRYGGGELARPEMSAGEIKQSRAAAALERRFSGKRATAEANRLDSIEAEHSGAQNRLDQYRLNKHYQGIRESKAAEASRMGGIESTHADAQKRLDEYRLKKHYDTERQKRSDLATYREAEAAEQQSEAARHSEGRDSRFSGRIGGRMAGLAGMSNLGRLGAGIAGAASIYGIKKALDFASDTTTQRDDLTGAQKFNHVLNALTMGISGSLINFRNALDGTTEGMRRAARSLVDRQTVASIQAQNRQELAGMQGNAAAARARASSLAGASASEMPGFDRWTMAGQQGYEEYQIVTPARDAAEASEREARAARLTEQSAGGRYAQAQARFQGAQSRRRSLGGRERSNVELENFTFDRNQLGRQQNLGSLQVANQNEAATFQEMIERRRELERAGVSAADAEYRARRANLDVMRSELEVLSQREQRLTGAASRLGSMNPIDRQLGFAAMRQVEADFENTTPEVRERARSFAPERFAQLATRFGETTDEFRAGRAAGDFGDQVGTGSIDSTRSQMVNLQQQIREATIGTERQLATSIADVIGRAMEEIGPILEQRIAQALRTLRTGRALQNNQLN